MKTIVVLASILAVVSAIPANTYNPKYDNFNVDDIVTNKRLLLNYMNCFLDMGPCTSEGTDFKRIIPEALKTKCAKCSPKQREHIRKMCQAFQTHFPAKWEQLRRKQDPKGEFVEFIDQFLN